MLFPITEECKRSSTEVLIPQTTDIILEVFVGTISSSEKFNSFSITDSKSRRVNELN